MPSTGRCRSGNWITILVSTRAATGCVYGVRVATAEALRAPPCCLAQASAFALRVDIGTSRKNNKQTL